MRRRLRTAVVDAEKVPAERDERLVAWLGDNLVAWGPAPLVVRQGDGQKVPAPTGWTLVRWDDGTLTVMSPVAERLNLEEGEAGE